MGQAANTFQIHNLSLEFFLTLAKSDGSQLKFDHRTEKVLEKINNRYADKLCR
jgi:hypothetical protein